ncbi:MAG: hypothetical protein K8963_04585, partial [Proteobacteria bacterium]|nr:hypothetical protein [Pseudomonadota bacterium]
DLRDVREKRRCTGLLSYKMRANSAVWSCAGLPPLLVLALVACPCLLVSCTDCAYGNVVRPHFADAIVASLMLDALL